MRAARAEGVDRERELGGRDEGTWMDTLCLRA